MASAALTTKPPKLCCTRDPPWISAFADQRIPATALAFVELEPADLNRRVHSDRITFHPGIIVPAAFDLRRRSTVER